MKITDALYGEHGMFYPVFDYVESVMRASPELNDLKSMVKIFKQMIVSHAALEEEILFPALEAQLGQAGPLTVMRAEHNQIDDFLDAILEAENVDVLSGNLSDLIALLRAHFAKEEQVLFVIAQKVLDEQTQMELADRWSEHRGVTVSSTDKKTCFG